jgi:hypothetical protein
MIMERITSRDAALPSPSAIEAIDKRRQWGLNFLVISGQFGFFAILLTLWTGQDLTYSCRSFRPVWQLPAARQSGILGPPAARQAVDACES